MGVIGTLYYAGLLLAPVEGFFTFVFSFSRPLYLFSDNHDTFKKSKTNKFKLEKENKTHNKNLKLPKKI